MTLGGTEDKNLFKTKRSQNILSRSSLKRLCTIMEYISVLRKTFYLLDRFRETDVDLTDKRCKTFRVDETKPTEYVYKSLAPVTPKRLEDSKSLLNPTKQSL